MHKSAEATPWAWLCYVSFALSAVLTFIKLFIAVVFNNLEKVRREEATAVQPAHESKDFSGELRALSAKLEELTAAIHAHNGAAGRHPLEDAKAAARRRT